MIRRLTEIRMYNLNWHNISIHPPLSFQHLELLSFIFSMLDSNSIIRETMSKLSGLESYPKLPRVSSLRINSNFSSYVDSKRQFFKPLPSTKSIWDRSISNFQDYFFLFRAETKGNYSIIICKRYSQHFSKFLTIFQQKSESTNEIKYRITKNLSHDKLLPPCNALLLPFPSLLHPLLILPTRVAREENKASPKTTRFKRLPGFDRSRMAFQCSHLASATSLLAYSLAAKVSQSSLLESGRLNFHRAALSREFVVTCFPYNGGTLEFATFQPISSRKVSRFSLER